MCTGLNLPGARCCCCCCCFLCFASRGYTGLGSGSRAADRIASACALCSTACAVEPRLRANHLAQLLVLLLLLLLLVLLLLLMHRRIRTACHHLMQRVRRTRCGGADAASKQLQVAGAVGRGHMRQQLQHSRPHCARACLGGSCVGCVALLLPLPLLLLLLLLLLLWVQEAV